MARSRQRQKPSFIWQPLLILLPVGVLAAVGFFSLRQDKIIAQHEAVDRAQTIVNDLLPRLWSALTNADTPEAFEHHAFQRDAAGELLFPPPIPSTLSPQPLNPDDLSTNQAALWQQAERAETLERDIPSTLQDIHAFLATKPPNRFAAVATYNLGVLLAKQEQPRPAADTFLSLLDTYPNTVAESGLPLDRLAEFKLLQLSAVMTNPRLAKVLISPDYFCSSIIFSPSVLTPTFLSWVCVHAETLGLKDGNEKWTHLWRDHEETRELYASVRPILLRDSNDHSKRRNGSSARTFWFNSGQQAWLAISFEEAPVSAAALERKAIYGTNTRTTSIADFNRRVSTGKSIYSRDHRNINVSSFEFEGAATEIESTVTNQWVLCRTESEVGRALYSLVHSERQIPDYSGVGIETAGKQLRESRPDLQLWHELGFFEGGGRRKVYSSNSATNILASAAISEGGVEQLKVNVYLTSPTTLFKRQSDRTFWFGALVATSAIAALIGLFSAWRAFNRQQELADLKSNFVSSVSHELRAPIASVRLMAESLERGKVADAPKQNEYFRFIGEECRRLSSLIENVLDFSRIEQGRKQYEFEPTDLLALVQQTVKLMEAYGVERQVSITLKLPDHQSSIFDYQLSLDGRAIQQALINLLDNAIKHSSNGQTVTVGLAILEQPNHQSLVNISVQDNGPGIPPEEHQKIFERFYRLGSELRRETQGVGIGLSIVKHIVEAHRGRVLVQSAPGQGSRFTIELPITSLRTHSQD